MKKSLAILFAFFVLGACSTVTHVDVDPVWQAIVSEKKIIVSDYGVVGTFDSSARVFTLAIHGDLDLEEGSTYESATYSSGSTSIKFYDVTPKSGGRYILILGDETIVEGFMWDGSEAGDESINEDWVGIVGGETVYVGSNDIGTFSVGATIFSYGTHELTFFQSTANSATYKGVGDDEKEIIAEFSVVDASSGIITVTVGGVVDQNLEDTTFEWSDSV